MEDRIPRYVPTDARIAMKSISPVRRTRIQEMESSRGQKAVKVYISHQNRDEHLTPLELERVLYRRIIIDRR
jgi:hypothetical protein